MVTTSNKHTSPYVFIPVPYHLSPHKLATVSLFVRKLFYFSDSVCVFLFLTPLERKVIKRGWCNAFLKCCGETYLTLFSQGSEGGGGAPEQWEGRPHVHPQDLPLVPILLLSSQNPPRGGGASFQTWRRGPRNRRRNRQGVEAAGVVMATGERGES